MFSKRCEGLQKFHFLIVAELILVKKSNIVTNNYIIFYFNLNKQFQVLKFVF